ncbi:MAG TPA: hypothetical protein VFD59_20975 [Nocardioidaceae bacterium]|nr:hypothetical protein [Nocardioidaceae bacterium]
MTGSSGVERSELEAVIETRRELGSAYEPALVDSFADKVEVAIATRVDAELARRQHDSRSTEARSKRQMVLGIVTLGAAIPITIPLALTDHLPAVLVAWTGMAVVNVSHAWQSRHAG